MQPIFLFRLGHRHLRSARRSSTHRFGSGPLDRSSAGPSHLGKCLDTLSANERLYIAAPKNGLFELAGYLSSRNQKYVLDFGPGFFEDCFAWPPSCVIFVAHSRTPEPQTENIPSKLIQGTPSIQNLAHLFIRKARLIGLPCSQVPMDKRLLEPLSCEEQSAP